MCVLYTAYDTLTYEILVKLNDQMKQNINLDF